MSTVSDETSGARKTTDERRELLARHVSMLDEWGNTSVARLGR